MLLPWAFGPPAPSLCRDGWFFSLRPQLHRYVLRDASVTVQLSLDLWSLAHQSLWFSASSLSLFNVILVCAFLNLLVIYLSVQGKSRPYESRDCFCLSCHGLPHPQIPFWVPADPWGVTASWQRLNPSAVSTDTTHHMGGGGANNISALFCCIPFVGFTFEQIPCLKSRHHTCFRSSTNEYIGFNKLTSSSLGSLTLYLNSLITRDFLIHTFHD